MTRRKPGGYVFRQEIQRVVIANRTAREALRRVVEESPGPATLALLIARVFASLVEILEAIREIEKIVEGDNDGRSD